jgi:hypothetical protein
VIQPARRVIWSVAEARCPRCSAFLLDSHRVILAERATVGPPALSPLANVVLAKGPVCFILDKINQVT